MEGMGWDRVERYGADESADEHMGWMGRDPRLHRPRYMEGRIKTERKSRVMKWTGILWYYGPEYYGKSQGVEIERDRSIMV